MGGRLPSRGNPMSEPSRRGLQPFGRAGGDVVRGARSGAPREAAPQTKHVPAAERSRIISLGSGLSHLESPDVGTIWWSRMGYSPHYCSAISHARSRRTLSPRFPLVASLGQAFGTAQRKHRSVRITLSLPARKCAGEHSKKNRSILAIPLQHRDLRMSKRFSNSAGFGPLLS